MIRQFTRSEHAKADDPHDPPEQTVRGVMTVGSAFRQAQNEHYDRLRRLHSVQEELGDLAEAILAPCAGVGLPVI